MGATQLTKEQLDALAHSLAFESATSIIDCNCVMTGRVEEFDSDVAPEYWGEWFDLDSCDIPEEDLNACVQYLEARGLLARHPIHSNWVTMFDESEATR